MWFKLFVLLRLPVSVICILGYSFALGAWGGPAMASLGGVLVVGPYVFLASTSMRLVRLRKGALNPAWWLLALETVGGILLLGAADYINTRDFELAVALVFASIVLVAWTLPNAVILYSQRAKFVEPAKEKPGL